jgi:hypothetical protein
VLARCGGDAGRHCVVQADQRDRPRAQRRLKRQPVEHGADAQPALHHARRCRADGFFFGRVQAEWQGGKTIRTQHVGHEAVAWMIAAGAVRMGDQQQRPGAVRHVQAIPPRFGVE